MYRFHFVKFLIQYIKEGIYLVFELKCNDYSACYIVRTGRHFKTRIKDHHSDDFQHKNQTLFSSHLIKENETLDQDNFKILLFSLKNAKLNSSDILGFQKVICRIRIFPIHYCVLIHLYYPDINFYFTVVKLKLLLTNLFDNINIIYL